MLKTWSKNQTEEDAMSDDHEHLWRHMINLIENKNLSQKTILDFGCNQGGFLRLLYEISVFKEGVGVDIAEESIRKANQTLGEQPIKFRNINALDQYQKFFDLAFSHEVLYLLDDLKNHSRKIKKCLKSGGIYYAAIGCHTDNPQWSKWRDIISEYSNVRVQNYSPDDFAQAFFEEEFLVSAKPFFFDGFVPLKMKNPYFPKLTDSLDYHVNNKILFRFQKT